MSSEVHDGSPLEQTPPPLPTTVAREELADPSRFHHGLDPAQPANHLSAQQASHIPPSQQADFLLAAGNFDPFDQILSTSPNSLISSLMNQEEINGNYGFDDLDFAQAWPNCFPVDNWHTSAPQDKPLGAANHSPAAFNYTTDPSSSVIQTDSMDAAPSSNHQSAVISSPPSLTSSSGILSLIHPKQGHERAKADKITLTGAFQKGSSHPNQQLRRLFDAIPHSQFYRNQEHEPRLCSQKASEFLEEAGTPGLADGAHEGESLYILFVHRETRTCLVCAKPHRALERAVSCSSIPFTAEVLLVSSATVVFETISPNKRIGTNVQLGESTLLFLTVRDSSVRIGDMKRHYAKKHRGDDAPNMKAERKQRSATSSRD
ncbi:hypothetical protein FRC17_006070 [Serendipita sp. 399]|nr:hypothetical protein FRC17_006070 [Serendipita sp. 399]